MKVCIVSSCGGHLTEVRCLLKAYCKYDYLYVLNDRVVLSADMKDKTQFITHSERDWKLILNLWEAFWILWKERPDIILSAGAGPVVDPLPCRSSLTPERENCTRILRPTFTRPSQI